MHARSISAAAVTAATIVTMLLLASCTFAQEDSSAQSNASTQDISGDMANIRVDGNRFVNEDGEVVVFRGVSFSDPDRLERAGQWNRPYFEAANAWNANIVRFPVHPQAWRDRGEDAYLALLDAGIAWAEELELYVIIDWHSIGNLRTEQFPRDIYETSMAETLEFWETIAERYAGNPTVAFYELFNEPTRSGGSLGSMTWSEYADLIEEIIRVVREHDESAIPLVAGFNWGYDLTHLREEPIDAPGIAYVAHPYPQKREPPWEEKWEADFGFAAETYPLIATEFGFMAEDGRGAHVPVIGDETYGQAIIDFFEARGISWTAWVFDPQWSPQLIENWDFEPTRQGRFFRQKMGELNPQ